LLTSVAALPACSTINPYTGQQQTSRAVQYGAIGAGFCGPDRPIDSNDNEQGRASNRRVELQIVAVKR
jgi:hypothetical protein